VKERVHFQGRHLAGGIKSNHGKVLSCLSFLLPRFEIDTYKMEKQALLPKLICLFLLKKRKLQNILNVGFITLFHALLIVPVFYSVGVRHMWLLV